MGMGGGAHGRLAPRWKRPPSRRRGLRALCRASAGRRESAASILFTCGGTGGHVYPAVAVADRLRSLVPDLAIDFVGSRDRIEWDVVPKSGYAVRSVPCAPIHRPLSSWRNVRSVLVQFLGLLKALWLLVRKRPRAVVGTGGYVTVPTCCAAWLLRIPVFLHESNAYPGLATRFLVNTLRCASQVYLGFEEAKRHLRGDKLVVTGNPVRAGILVKHQKADFGRGATGALADVFNDGPSRDRDSFRICIMGGSLGAQKINEVLHDCVGGILTKFTKVSVIWQTGQGYYDEVDQDCGVFPGRLAILPFLHDMPLVYSSCDLFVCRAGAITCSELVAARKPSILIPSPNVTDDHQTKNAAALEKAGWTVMLQEEDFTSRKLLDTLDGLLCDNGRALKRMQVALQDAGENRACNDIAESLASSLEL